MRYIIILILGCFIIIHEGYSQNDVIIDPIIKCCYKLNPQTSIKVLNSKSNYTGRVVLQAEIDTTQLRLINHKIMFAKLKSKANPLDTIEVRINIKSGNYQKLKKMLPEILKHIEYLRVNKVNSNKCTKCRFDIPVRIE